MTCSARFADADDYDALLCAGIDLTDASEVAQVNLFLDIAASDIHAAMAAQGMCDCTLASWATVYLQKLNIIDAQVIHNCPCGNRLKDEQRDALRTWIDQQLELIRTGKLTLCVDDTGTEFPAFGVAQMSYTGWSQAEIIANEALKRLP